MARSRARPPGSYNTDLTATTPSIPTASSSSASAATAEPEDNTDDYSLRTRKLGSSPGPSELVHSESEPWQPTTSSAIGLPNPSPPLPPPFLTSATYLCDARGNIIGKPGIPCDAYTNSNRTTIGAPPSPGVKTEVKRYRRVLRSRQQPLAARTHHPPQELLPTLLSPTSAPHPRRHPTKRNRRALQKLHAAAKLLRCSVELGKRTIVISAPVRVLPRSSLIPSKRTLALP